ncbi:hypothetical protein AKO1_007425 [Acrasis kona]|uniref:Uncharacterized protein n=1 Tax=Acrasis kona TaxID=1008807 RepID=A0AAW2YQS0_9EUKA
MSSNNNKPSNEDKIKLLMQTLTNQITSEAVNNNYFITHQNVNYPHFAQTRSSNTTNNSPWIRTTQPQPASVTNSQIPMFNNPPTQPVQSTLQYMEGYEQHEPTPPKPKDTKKRKTNRKKPKNKKRKVEETAEETVQEEAQVQSDDTPREDSPPSPRGDYESEVIESVLNNKELDTFSLRLFCKENSHLVGQLSPELSKRIEAILEEEEAEEACAPPPNNANSGYERSLSEDEINRLPDDLKASYLANEFDPHVFRDYVYTNNLLQPTKQDLDPLYGDFMTSLGSSYFEDKFSICIRISKKYNVSDDIKSLIFSQEDPARFAPPKDEEDDDDVVWVDEKQGHLEELDNTIVDLRTKILHYKASELVLDHVTKLFEKVYRSIK